MCEVHASAAEGIGERRAPIGRRVPHLDDSCKGQAPFAPLDPCDHVLTRHGTRHEDDLPVVPGDHPAARGRLFDGKLEFLSWGEHVTGRESLIPNLGQAQRVSDEPLERGLDGLRPDFRRQARAKGRELGFRLSSRRHNRVRIQLGCRGLHQPPIELGQPIQDGRARVAARSFRFARQPIDLGEQALDVLLERR